MHIYHIWIILGIVLLICEIFTPGFFIASVGLGAFLSAIAAYYQLSMTWQILALATGTILSFILIRPFIYLKHKPGDGRQTGTYALIGKSALVTEKIVNHTNRGRIKVGGEEWKARSLSGQDIGKDNIVTIEKIEGATLLVNQQTKEKES